MFNVSVKGLYLFVLGLQGPFLQRACNFTVTGFGTSRGPAKDISLPLGVPKAVSFERKQMLHRSITKGQQTIETAEMEKRLYARAAPP